MRCVVHDLAVFLAAGMLVAAAPAPQTAPSPSHTTPAPSRDTVRLVRPGQSIQAAVDAARPGDTVLVAKGTYRENVLVRTDDLTIRGQGPDTVLLQPEQEDMSARCHFGNGLCVDGQATDRVSGVRIASLQIRGFTANGIAAGDVDRLRVDGVLIRDSGTAVDLTASTGAAITGNTITDNAYGVILRGAPAPNTGADNTVAGNVVSGTRGTAVLVVQDARARITGNRIRSGCGGVVLLGGRQIVVRDNTITGNTRTCTGGDGDARWQWGGLGIELLGAKDSVVSGNTVTGNRGTGTEAGGILLGRDYGDSPATGNTITGNTARQNAPADLVDRSGGTNRITDNHCGTSIPARLCR